MSITTTTPITDRHADLVAVAAIGSGVVGGVFFTFSTSIMKSLDRLPAEQSIQAMQAFNKDVPNAWFMTFMFGTAFLCIWLAITAIRRHGRPGSIYLVLGAALYLVAIAVTAIYHVPVNDGIDKVVPSTPDAAKEWADFAPGWNAWNHVRTITSIAACALFLLSVRVQRPIHRSS